MTIRGADYPRRKNDNYPTPPEVSRVLFESVVFDDVVYDPACGRERKILKVAQRYGYSVAGSDIITGADFLEKPRTFTSNFSIVTNPPYGDRRGSMTLRFIEQSLVLTKPRDGRVAMLLPIDYDSGKTRSHVFQHPAFALKIVLLDRIRWFNDQSGSINHAWYLWSWDHKGAPIIKYARIAYQ